jgi:hypothetical protein
LVRALKRCADGQMLIWLERRALDKLDALRQPGEGYSEVILRMAAVGHKSLNRS